MSVRTRKRRSMTPADKVYSSVYTAEQIAQLTGFSARTIRRAFEIGTIPNVVKPGAGKAKMPARVATWASLKSFMRKRGIELMRVKG